jgi:hypothetical protein
MYFDDVFEYIGGAGAYQLGNLAFTFAIFAMSIDAMRMNFVGGSMEHWCKIPELANFTHDDQKYIGIPDTGPTDSRRRTWLSDLFGLPYSSEPVELEYDSCYRFPIDYANYSQDELRKWNRTEMTSDIPESEWVRCDSGWVYDQSEFYSTIGSEVWTKI